MDTIPLMKFDADIGQGEIPGDKSRAKIHRKTESSNTGKILVLQATIPSVVILVSSQLDGLSKRISDALFTLSDQALRPEDAKISLEAHQLILRNMPTFYRLVAENINTALHKEVSTVNIKKRPLSETLLTTQSAEEHAQQAYEDVERKILIRHLSQALEVMSAEPLMTLNVLIGRLLNRPPIDVSQNPFRPEIFVNAVVQAWTELDTNTESHLVVLRLLQPSLFLQLVPVLELVNQELMARGVIPEASKEITGKSRVKRTVPSATSIYDRDPVVHDKINSILSGKLDLSSKPELTGTENDTLLTDAHHIKAETQSVDLGKIDHETIDKQFFEALTEMQRNFAAADHTVGHVEPCLRDLFYETSAESLTLIERNTIELLARVFDYIFADTSIREDIRSLIGELQIPILRVALLDADFFKRDSHPARTLLDMLGRSGLRGDEGADSLLDVIEGVVERVQFEFDEQIELFSDVVADLEAFLKEEELKAEAAISEPVQAALTQEKMRLARELAAQDVAIRLETGEVAGFLETFLLEQWIRILTIAHSVKDEKLHALENALKTMDDLIWSLKPKNSAKERGELISTLPAMLSLLNAWLNAIRWDEPERVIFFSKLAERHASMARAPLELSPRRQLEIAVNIAQRASNRRLDRFVLGKLDQVDDETSKHVEALERGMWLDFTRDNDQVCRYKLAWISPKRTNYIFTNRQGFEAFSIEKEELLRQFREGLVTTIVIDSLVDRALIFALRELPT